MTDDRSERVRRVTEEIVERDAEALRRLAGGDEDLVQRMMERQIEPQVRADALRDEGMDVSVAMVNTDPGADGFLVQCVGCGREARLPFDPGSKVVMCPQCQRGLA